MNQYSTRTVRRLAAAEGYLELDLPENALSELEGLETSGPYEAIANLLRGEAYKAQQRYTEAIPALVRAAELFPAPYCRRAWLSLGACYREQGQAELAEAAQRAAEVCEQVLEAENEGLMIHASLTLKIVIKLRPQSR